VNRFHNDHPFFNGGLPVWTSRPSAGGVSLFSRNFLAGAHVPISSAAGAGADLFQPEINPRSSGTLPREAATVLTCCPLPDNEISGCRDAESQADKGQA